VNAYSVSLVMICPAAAMAQVNALGAALGHSENEFGVPLSPTGEEPATHYGLHTWATEETALAWTEAETVGELTPEQTTAVRSMLIISPSEEMTGSDHFASVLVDNGLVRVESND
jgi:hypothetical protein